MISRFVPRIPLPHSSAEAQALAQELAAALRASGSWRKPVPIKTWENAAGWIFHQAGMYWHQYLILQETMSTFTAAGGSGDPSPVFHAHLARLAGSEPLPAKVRRYYEVALALAPQHAETHYNLGTLEQRAGTLDAAFMRFETVTRLGPSPGGQPHAYLLANSRWRMAEILLAQRRKKEAAKCFDLGMRDLSNFGPDHAIYARLLRRLGREAEATTHFDRIMSYSHRYAPEFILPVLEKQCMLPRDASGHPLDLFAVTELGRSPTGARILFHGGLYFRLPAGREEWPRPAGLRIEAGQRSLRERLFGPSPDRTICALQRETLDQGA